MKKSTGVLCVVCGTDIVAEVSDLPTVNLGEMPIGPASRDFVQKAVSGFYCPGCGLVYHHPPGRPQAVTEILASLEQEQG